MTQSYLDHYAEITVMPTLREISASCGISIRFPEKELKKVVKAMKKLNLSEQMFQIYEIREENGTISTSLISN